MPNKRLKTLPPEVSFWKGQGGKASSADWESARVVSQNTGDRE